MTYNPYRDPSKNIDWEHLYFENSLQRATYIQNNGITNVPDISLINELIYFPPPLNLNISSHTNYIYTDGAFIQPNDRATPSPAGIGIYSPNLQSTSNNNGYAFICPAPTSIFLAELLAILFAVSISPPSTTTIIYSDNLAAITIINDFLRKEARQKIHKLKHIHILRNIEFLIQKRKLSIQLTHINSHLREKISALKNNPDPSAKIPLQSLYLHLEEQYGEDYQQHGLWK